MDGRKTKTHDRVSWVEHSDFTVLWRSAWQNQPASGEAQAAQVAHQSRTKCLERQPYSKAPQMSSSQDDWALKVLSQLVQHLQLHELSAFFQKVLAEPPFSLYSALDLSHFYVCVVCFLLTDRVPL